MLRVRRIVDVEEFVGVPGDPAGYAESVRDLWESESSRPDWCFLLEDGPTTVGRIGFRVAPTVSDPARLGSLPPEELFVFGLHLPWDDDFVDLGRRLIATAAGSIADEVPAMLEIRINNSVHSHPEARHALMDRLGFDLFQEKHGFSWSDTGAPIDPGDRLEFRTMSEVGVEAYRAMMAPCGEGTLDRNDRYYWAGCGPDGWAAQMTEYLVEEDAHMWLVGFRGDEPVGYVAVMGVEDWGSTIVHIGVLPDHRGNAYVQDLLLAGTAAARRSGIAGMLSDVDVGNEPMLHAMARAGHVRDPGRWHLRVHRADLAALAG